MRFVGETIGKNKEFLSSTEMRGGRVIEDHSREGGPRADGVVCYAGVDWWYHNRGHSECQIMRRLAQRVPVLWVNSIGMRMPTPGKSELVLHRYARKIRSTLKGLTRDQCGLWIYSPLFIPRYTPQILALNGWLLNAQIRFLTRRLGIFHPSAWITVPTAGPALKRGRWHKTVFNRSDVFSSFPEVDRSVISQLEEGLLACCDDVLYVNQRLMAAEKDRVRQAHFIDHGVDFEHFASVRTPEGPCVPAPESIANLPHPIVGFYGALDDYTIDLELMIETARLIPNGTLLVIGPKAMELQKLLEEPNVTYLGPIPYEELPQYAAHFDVGIMPWLQNDWIDGCNPIKLKEFLALGFPVATMRFPQLRPYEDLVHAADTRSDFLSAIDAALGENSPQAARARRARVCNTDGGWDAIAARVGALLGLNLD